MCQPSTKERSNAAAAEPTEQEQAWALRLKRAAEAPNSGINTDDVSDFEFIQHAVVCKNNTTAGLSRLRNLQALKARYGIIRDGSVEEAARDLKIFLQTHPGLYLSLATSTTSKDNKNDQAATTPSPLPLPAGTQVFCSEYQHFQAARMKSEESYAVYLRAAFYVLQASQYDLQAVRSGIRILMDVKGALRYRSFETERRARELYGRAYPIRIQGVVLLRASSFLRTAYSWLLRPWMSRKVKALLDMPAAKRDEYLQNDSAVPAACLPQAWGGDLEGEAFYDAILERLQRRYQHAATFSLEEELQGEEDED